MVVKVEFNIEIPDIQHSEDELEGFCCLSLSKQVK